MYKASKSPNFREQKEWSYPAAKEKKVGAILSSIWPGGRTYGGGRMVAERSAEVGGGGGRQEAVSKNKTAERRKILLATTDFFSWKRAEYDCTVITAEGTRYPVPFQCSFRPLFKRLPFLFQLSHCFLYWASLRKALPPFEFALPLLESHAICFLTSMFFISP